MRKERARLAILHYITQFSLSHTFGDGKSYGGLLSAAFTVDHTYRDVRVGDLVALSSVPVSKFYLGWLIETRETSPGWPEFLLESIEDGSQCWWENVGVTYMNRKTVAEHPEWRWDDKQYALNDRWNRACYRKRDAYIYLPMRAEFVGLSVKLGVRVRHNFSPERKYQTFDDWRKVKMADMLTFYDDAVRQLESSKPATREGRAG